MSDEIRKPVSYPERSGLQQRMQFVDASTIQQQIDEKLKTLPADANGAVVAHMNTHGEGMMSVFGRVNDQWSYVGTVTHAPGSGWLGDVAVRYTW